MWTLAVATRDLAHTSTDMPRGVTFTIWPSWIEPQKTKGLIKGWCASIVGSGVDALILFDAINIRYATGTCRFSACGMPNHAICCLPQTAPFCFEFMGCLHLAKGYENINEVRPGTTASFVAAGLNINEREQSWAKSMAGTIISLVWQGCKLGLEYLNANVLIAMKARCLLLLTPKNLLKWRGPSNQVKR